MRIGLVGCGRWGRNILRDLLALGVRVAVADIDPEARRMAAGLGSECVVAEMGELPDCEGIVIAVDSTSHGAVLERGLARGVPMFVEKPMTVNGVQARSMAKRASGRLFVMDKWRYHAGIEEMRRIRESGELGSAVGMRLIHAGWGQPHHDVDIVWILLPHCLGIFLEIFGELPRARSAWVERFDGRAVAMTGVMGDAPWGEFHVSARSPVKRREFVLYFEGGVVWLDEGWADYINVVRGLAGVDNGDARGVERRAVPGELPLLKELRTFVEHLRGGPVPRSSAEDGALMVERVEEFRRLAGLEP